jgi:hypothetical protein
MNMRTTLTFGVPTFLLLLGGCIIVDGTPNNNTGGAGGSTTTSSSSGDVGVGGAGGGAGAGGAGGTAGAGGGSSCVGPEDGKLDSLACDALNTQMTGKVCGPNGDQDPLANGTCTLGAQIYQAGAFDVLATCLKLIEKDPMFACDDKKVGDCVAQMYTAACPSQAAAAACEQISKTLCINMEVFDTQGCMLKTNPLNGTALQDLANCISMSPEPDCNKAFTACFDKITSF